MPKLQHVIEINISPEKFLDNCSPEELIELEILISSPRYQVKKWDHQQQKEHSPSEQLDLEIEASKKNSV